MARYKKRFRAFDPDPDCPTTVCEMPGCCNPAGYKAPKSPKKLNEYFWFCLEHVREYNKSWDFCKNMNLHEIEENLRSATVWNKPSWKLGHLGRIDRYKQEHFIDAFNILNNSEVSAFKEQNSSIHTKIPLELENSIEILAIDWPITLAELKKRYMNLAKQYHPDRNNGNQNLEEQFKLINAAYSQLRTHLTKAS